ncbi:hypothetical protein BGX21_008753 [Mortierella sp. AD011]|nr:hypothetical protein BGX20_002044 [Mortierella sp. AD010]KAF9397544.1 hypothetical protein BGX21_008753 [Mortierella sp. AD011]
MFDMFDIHSKNTLSAVKSLNLIQILLNDARVQDSNNADIKFILCNYVDVLLAHMKNIVKRPSTGIHSKDDGDQTLREEIASANLDHANLVADLGHPELALKSRKRAEKWGGPGIKKPLAPPVKTPTVEVDVAVVPDDIFSEDIPPFTISWTFPDPDGRVADTPQLVSCLGLLKQSPQDLLEDSLDAVARKWFKDTTKNPDEKTRLETLASELVRAFTRDEIKDKKAISEILCVVPVLEEENIRFLLRQFQANFESSRILDIGALRGLAQLIQTASPSHLHVQDLIEVLGPMSMRLQETHDQSPDHIFELTVAVSSVLDAMADAKVAGLDRVGLHEPLLGYLSGLQTSDDPQLKYYASYAFQALLCVPDNESPWQATVRRTTTIVKGISGLVTAVKGLDLNGFISGLRSIQEGFEGVQQVFGLAKTALEDVSAVYEGGHDLVTSLKEGLKLNKKRAWYSALRGADTLINGGELAKLRLLVCSAPCRREIDFQWGVCQRLGGIAANKLWGDKIRQESVRFLVEIYCNDLDWGKNHPIKGFILDILKQLSVTCKDLAGTTQLIENLANDGDAAKQDIYRYHTANESSPPFFVMLCSPELAYPSLLDRVQQKTDVEADLRRIFRARMKERGGTVYVPPLAKTHLQATDDALFSLIPMVDEFLSSNLRVLLLLGDSGAGKTMFNQELDLKLWMAYMANPKTARVPLLISLPAINQPEKDLIAKHLRISEFSEPQIREMKNRELVIICDGYDESQQFQNLYESNGFNKDGGWQVQMIISCRSEHLGQDYRYLFQPAQTSATDSSLFRQAVLVPFSMDQIKDYIARYVSIKKPLWGPTDYEGVLEQIPSLQDLVKNPFLLTLSLEVLPRITDPNQKLTANKITRVLLYDEFIAQWLERNKKRLAVQDLSDPERKALESLSEDGFTQEGLRFLKDLSAAVYNEQDGTPVIEYSKARDIGSWKEIFFSRKDEEIRLLQRAIPMTRNGSRFGFIHRSILEYGVSRAIYEPQHQTGFKLEAVESSSHLQQRRKSTDSVYSFQEVFQATETTIKKKAMEPSMESPLARRYFIKDHSVMQFLVDRVQSEPAFREQLFAYIHASKKNKMWRIAAANSITILIRAGVSLSNQNLRGIQVPMADMSFGFFDSAQLNGADLRKTNFQSAWLRHADLTQARTEGIQFGEWPTLSDAKMSKALTYTPDGRMFVAGTNEGDIILYNASTWAILATLKGHDRAVTHLVVSQDGLYLASGGDGFNSDISAKIWDLQEGTCVHTLEGHTSDFTGLIFMPSGQQIVTGSKCHSVHLWEVQTGEKVHSFQVEPDQATVNAIACSSDGELLASTYEDYYLRLWNIKTSECIRVLSSQDSWILGVAFSPDVKQVSVTTEQGIKTWEIATGNELWTLEESIRWNPAVYSPDSRLMAFGDMDNRLTLLDPKTGKTRLKLQGHSDTIYSIDFSPDNTQVATASSDRTVRLWDPQTGAPGPVFQGHTEPVLTVKFSPSGRQLSSSSWDNTIRLFDTRTSNTVNLQQRELHKSYATSYFVPGGQYIISQCRAWMRIWQTQTGNLIHNISTAWQCTSGPEFISPCGLHIVSVSNKDASLWDIEKGRCIWSIYLDEFFADLGTISFSPDGDRLATSGSKSAGVWNRHTGALEHRLIGHEEVISQLLFSPNGGKQLATGSYDSTMRLWDVSTGKCTVTLELPWRASAAAYSFDGSRITAACWSVIKSWDTTTGQSLQEIETGCDSPLLFFSDNRFLIAYSDFRSSSGEEGTLQVWDTVKGERVWTLGTIEGYTLAAVSPDGQFLVTCRQDTDDAIQLWDLQNGQHIATTENYQRQHTSLSLEMLTAVCKGDETAETHEFSMTVGTAYGEISFWKIVQDGELHLRDGAVERAVNKDSSESDQNTLDNSSDGENNKKNGRSPAKSYKFVMLWTTAYGKFNAAGAKIENVQGLSRANTRLLKQYGAHGAVVAPLGLHQAAIKMMSSKSFVARVRTKLAAKKTSINVARTVEEINGDDGREEEEGRKEIGGESTESPEAKDYNLESSGKDANQIKE